MFSSATSWIGTLSEKYPRQICLVQLHLIKTSVGSICLMYSMMPLLSNKRHFPWDTSNVADMTDSTKDVLLFPATRPLRQSCLACSLMPLHSNQNKFLLRHPNVMVMSWMLKSTTKTLPHGIYRTRRICLQCHKRSLHSIKTIPLGSHPMWQE